MRNEAGQVILVLILVMTVALAIGISVIQRSISDISTASKGEQSSRAFSAAEAGIEKAIQTNSSVSNFPLDNNAIIQGVDKNDIPAAGNALEYPPMAKEEMAQVWLADPTANLPTCSAPNVCYIQPSFNVYFGKYNTTDFPALEVTVVSWDGSRYVPTKRFYDSNTVRASSNNFNRDGVPTCNNPTVRTNANATDSQFYCSVSVSGYPYSGSAKPILVRLRLLYSSSSHPVAVGPTSGSLPVQAKIFTSTGTSGQTQRKVQVFRLDKVVPPYFDYAIFSTGAINK